MNKSKKNLIMICIDGCRSDRANSSKIFSEYLPGTVFFSESITYAPYTNSSMFAVFSGTYGNRNGCYSYWHSIKFKKDSFKTLTHYLHDNNYSTSADIHSKLAIPLDYFDEYNVYDETSIDLPSRHKQLIIDAKNQNNQGNPFFLYLHYSSIHTGIMNDVMKIYNNFSEDYFNQKENNDKRYNSLFHNAENYLQIILDTIQDNNLLQNSLIVILSDHGVSLGEKFGEMAYGAFCYDYTIKTFSCLINTTMNSQKISQQVRHVDLLPTILEYLDIKPDLQFEQIDGKSLLPLIEHNVVDEQIAYTETANPLKSDKPPKIPNTKSVRTTKWKLIHNEYNNTKELYNLENDPDELNNLIGTGLEIENILLDKLLTIQTHNSY